MSGFALVFDRKTPLPAQSPIFTEFLNSVADYKCLDKPKEFVTGGQAVAAKLDSDSTLHRGYLVDEATGSWLLAAGTVIDPMNVTPDGSLDRLLIDYLERGLEVFERLDGQFALVIYNGRDDEALVVSDPFGLVSIFYGQRGSQLFVSTSALAVARAVQSKPDEFGVRFFIGYGAALGETTLWQDVKRVLPATVLKITGCGVKAVNYWTFKFDESVFNLPLKKSVDYVIEVLSNGMQRGLAREGKSWLSLTGGFDSRTLAAMTHRAALPFKSYCHGPSDTRDVKIASFISQKMGWDHEYFSLPEDWGQQRPAWLARTLGQSDGHLDVLKLSRIIREQTLKAEQYPASLWGYGGETYRGYYWKQEFFNIGVTSKVNYERLLDYRLTPSSGFILKDNSEWLRLMREELKTQLKTIGEQQVNWPNTLKLDLIGQYLEHSLSGATISTVMGLQRVIAPLDFKECVAAVLSVNYKWRTHGRLFRLMLERTNPLLANIDTADGGPAIPMRLTNLHKFGPYWFNVGEKLMWGIGRKVLGKSLWNKRDRGPAGTAYPLDQWRRDTLAQLEDEMLLTPAKMHSNSLYDRDSFQALLVKAQTDNFPSETSLGRILTVEMALRSVGTSL